MTAATSTPTASAPDLEVGMAVRITGGKYNGLQGQLAKLCATAGSVIVHYEGRAHELVIDVAHVVELAYWRAQRSATELALRGAN